MNGGGFHVHIFCERMHKKEEKKREAEEERIQRNESFASDSRLWRQGGRFPGATGEKHDVCATQACSSVRERLRISYKARALKPLILPNTGYKCVA